MTEIRRSTILLKKTSTSSLQYHFKDSGSLLQFISVEMLIQTKKKEQLG